MAFTEGALPGGAPFFAQTSFKSELCCLTTADRTADWESILS